MTRGLFADLALWMLASGLLAGLLFPFLANALGVSPQEAFSLRFFMATSAAGLCVGGVSFLLARNVVRPRLRMLAAQMREVADNIERTTYGSELAVCDPSSCKIDLESADEIGDCAGAFNSLIDALVQSQEVESALGKFSAAMSDQLELAALTRRALDLMLDYSGAVGGAVIVECGGELKVLARHALDESTHLDRSDHVRRAMETGERRRLPVGDDHTVDAAIARVQPREVLIFPVVHKATPLGAVVLAATRALAPETLRLLELLLRGLALALQNALIHDQLQRIAALDPLTGAYNRRFGMKRLREELKRAHRAHSPIAVVLFDVDHFKRVNDVHGHLMGDQVLAAIVRNAMEESREGDVVIRYGGEEFLMLLPGASQEGGQQIAERLRRRVAETEQPTGGRRVQVTISAGIAAYPEDSPEADSDALLQKADEALYVAKANGRNRAVGARSARPRRPSAQAAKEKEVDAAR
ncbi:MAG: GGDEF domain-containing protein [Chromatiales bacterium]